MTASPLLGLERGLAVAMSEVVLRTSVAMALVELCKYQSAHAALQFYGRQSIFYCYFSIC